MKPSPWEAVSCVIVALAVIVALSYAPPVPALQWRDPAVELPAEAERMELPEVPDLLLKAMVERRYK